MEVASFFHGWLVSLVRQWEYSNVFFKSYSIPCKSMAFLLNTPSSIYLKIDKHTLLLDRMSVAVQQYPHAVTRLFGEIDGINPTSQCVRDGCVSKIIRTAVFNTAAYENLFPGSFIKVVVVNRTTLGCSKYQIVWLRIETIESRCHHRLHCGC
jgi:hypothetical protein